MTGRKETIEHARTFPPLPEIDDATRKEFLVGAAGLLLLAPYACGGGGSGDEGSSGETRTIEHELGTAQVPLDPRRVVVLDTFLTLQGAVEAGVPVVGSTVRSPEDRFPAVLTEEEIRGITGVGIDGEPNLESIAALEPDLILTTTFIDPPYDQLRRIAPTVVLGDFFDWKAYLRSLAKATGRSRRVEEDLAGYEARVEELRGRLREVTVSYAALRGNESFDVNLEGPDAWGPSRILEELGVERPPSEVTQQEGTFQRTLSLEKLPDIAGDVLLYEVGYPGLDDASLQGARQVVGGPLWQEIPAVQDGEAHRVDPDHWAMFGGLRSANLVLDDIEKHLT